MSHFSYSRDKLRQGSDSWLPAFSSSFKITLSWAGLGTSHKTSSEKYKHKWQGFHQLMTRVFKTSWANLQPLLAALHSWRKKTWEKEANPTSTRSIQQPNSCVPRPGLSQQNEFSSLAMVSTSSAQPWASRQPEHKPESLETLPISLTNGLYGHGQLHSSCWPLVTTFSKGITLFLECLASCGWKQLCKEEGLDVFSNCQRQSERCFIYLPVFSCNTSLCKNIFGLLSYCKVSFPVLWGKVWQIMKVGFRAWVEQSHVRRFPLRW